MSDIYFFDVNCLLGRRNYYQGRYFWKKENLLNTMDHYQIKKALVYHSLMREHNPQQGNRVLLEEIKGDDHLLPVQAALPNGDIFGVEEMPTTDEFINQLEKNNVRAVRLFPDDSIHRFSLQEWSLGEFYGKLADIGIPLLLDFGTIFYGKEKINWNVIYEICRNHPRLPLILIGPDYRSCRRIFPLFKSCSNLKIDISRFMTHRGLEFVCQEFGADRLLFGTKLPFQNPGAIITMVLYARISKEEKILIAGQNLDNLLAGVRW